MLFNAIIIFAILFILICVIVDLITGDNCTPAPPRKK